MTNDNTRTRQWLTLAMFVMLAVAVAVLAAVVGGAL